MAIYHFHVAQISRGKGQTAVSAAAYRAGEKLHDNYYGEEPDYTKKGGVLYTEIILPEHAPREYADRETLWNAIKELKHEEARAKGENGELSSALFFYLGKNTEKCYRAETKVKMTAEVLAFVEKYHITKLDDFQGVVTNLYNQVATLRKEIRELQAEKKGVEEMLRMYQQYKETLLVYKEWYAISNPEKKAAFETAHDGELMKFHMAERVLKKNYPDMRIPVKALKKKSEELASVIKGISPKLESVKEEAKQAYKLKCRIADAYKQTQKNTKREEQSL